MNKKKNNNNKKKHGGILCCTTAPKHEVSSGLWLINPVFYGRKPAFPPQQLSVANGSLDRVGFVCLLSLLHTFSGRLLVCFWPPN